MTGLVDTSILHNCILIGCGWWKQYLLGGIAFEASGCGPDQLWLVIDSHWVFFNLKRPDHLCFEFRGNWTVVQFGPVASLQISCQLDFETLLQMEDPALNPAWMNDFKVFVLELQTNFGPHDPVGDVEHQWDHLSIKDGQCINKYVVKFSWIASQVWGYMPSGTTFTMVSLIILRTRSLKLENLQLSTNSIPLSRLLMHAIGSASLRLTARQNLSTALPPHPPGPPTNPLHPSPLETILAPSNLKKVL